MKKNDCLPLCSAWFICTRLHCGLVQAKICRIAIEAAKTVLDQIMDAEDHSIPMNILQQATCVGVVPGMIKGAFVFGAQYGQGVVTCRTGHGWSAPVFIRMAGGSWGLQIGGQSTDLILVAVNDRGFQDLLKNKFKIGGDASAAAGPVGRSGQAATDWKMNAELLSYSRNKGLFAGIESGRHQRQPEPGRYRNLLRPPAELRDVLKGNVASRRLRRICARCGAYLSKPSSARKTVRVTEYRCAPQSSFRSSRHSVHCSLLDCSLFMLHSLLWRQSVMFPFALSVTP